MLVLFTLVTALVVGAIAALALEKWWVIFIPLVLHAIGTTIVVGGVFKRVEQQDKPDPVTEARLEEEGKL
jgi:membrane protein implicated in regulation of membrane protease activity